METEEITAEGLQQAYARSLRGMLHPDYAGKHVNRKSIRAMLRETEESDGATLTPQAGTATWLWSDLHLHHRNIIRYCSRPFHSVEEMNNELLCAWRDTVAAADTIVCGGDVALAGSLRGGREGSVTLMPGRKLLVRGNHDFDRRGKPAPTGIRNTSMSLLIEGDPPLLVTHIPMTRVPAGGVNVYGHTHNNERPREGRYVNICVEQTGYRPLRLEDVRRLAAGRLADPRPRAATTLEEMCASSRIVPCRTQQSWPPKPATTGSERAEHQGNTGRIRPKHGNPGRTMTQSGQWRR